MSAIEKFKERVHASEERNRKSSTLEIAPHISVNLSAMRELLTEIEALEKENEYHKEYIVYLLGNYTEEEFNEIAEKYAIKEDTRHERD